MKVGWGDLEREPSLGHVGLWMDVDGGAERVRLKRVFGDLGLCDTCSINSGTLHSDMFKYVLRTAKSNGVLCLTLELVWTSWGSKVNIRNT
jgi:hypothetical protein